MSLLELSMSHIADSCRNQLELVDALESNGDAMPPKLAAALSFSLHLAEHPSCRLRSGGG